LRGGDKEYEIVRKGSRSENSLKEEDKMVAKHKKTKGNIIGVLLVVVGLISLISYPALGEKTIEVWFPPYEGDYLISTVIPAFEEKYPDVSVALTKVPWANLSEKLTVSTVGGVLPNIVVLSSQHMAVAMEMGVLEPLDEYFKRDGFSKKDFYPTSFDAYSIWNDTIYSIPAWMELPCPHWRKDLFKEAGYDRPPQTWDEILEYAPKFKIDKDGDGKIDQYLMNMPYKGEWITSFLGDWLYQNGGGIVSPDLSEVLINKKSSVEALQFYVDLGKKYGAALPPERCSAYGAEEFMNGTVAMVIMGGWFKGAIRSKMPPEFEQSWDIALPFRGKKGRSLNGAPGAVLSIASKDNKEAAWSFIKSFITSAPFMEKAGVIPPYLPLFRSQEFKKDKKNEIYFKLEELMSKGEIKPWYDPCTSKLGEIKEAITRMVQKVAFENIEPQKAADECAKTIEKLLISSK